MAEGRRSWRTHPATTGLVTLCSVIFVLTFVVAGLRSDDLGSSALSSLWSLDEVDVLVDFGGLAAARVWLDGEWWRVLTAGLLHGSWVHLLLNMVGLLAVGEWTERVWGWWRQLLLFFVASVGGCLASLAWAEAGMVVGASAGIFGIAGALVVARAWGRPELKAALEPISARRLSFLLGFWLLVGMLLPLAFGVSIVAQAGHIGGLVFGVAVGWLFSRPPKRRFATVLAWLGIVAGLGGLAYAANAPAWRPNYDMILGADLLERGEFERAARHLEDALADAPEDHGRANAVAYALAEAGVELDHAEELVRFALEQDPGSAEYLDTLGWIQCKQGHVGAARVQLRLADALAEREIEEIGEHLEQCDDVFPVEHLD